MRKGKSISKLSAQGHFGHVAFHYLSTSAAEGVLPLKEVENSEVWISIFKPEEHFHVTATSKVHCRAEG
jgi:hypothetical protein